MIRIGSIFPQQNQDNGKLGNVDLAIIKGMWTRLDEYDFEL